MVFSKEIANAYKLYQLLLFHFQEKRVDEFFELIQENLNVVNHYFQTVFRTFLRHKQIHQECARNRLFKRKTRSD
ncbi:transposase [Streptococcus thermophilus]|nr:Transposase [Streptococcus thermophilus CNCM I-1630]CAD0159309.1 transposase [Streptococcus thermophilus]CAD0164169.1 transposase [Streptococcus thermophilus]CAD0164180.1 transposase [Streptococcus thermophilus]CAD0164981.1 transposase [Streptococcus thermophilus]